MDARNPSKTVLMALKMDKLAKSSDKLLRWINDLNPGLHTKQ
jgi:hypothetical protein